MSLFGENQAHETVASNGQLDNNGATGNIEELLGQSIGENNNDDYQEQLPIENENISTETEFAPEPEKYNPEYEKKVAYIKEKFQTKDEFVKSVDGLAVKLGIDPNTLRFNSQEEAINAYMQMEEALGNSGQPSPLEQPQQIYDDSYYLKQEVDGLKTAFMQLLSNRQQNPQQPLRDPNTGRFIPLNNNQQNIPNQEQATSQEEQNFIDGIDWEKAYEDKTYLLNIMDKRAEIKARQAVNEYQQQRQAEEEQLKTKQNEAQARYQSYQMQVTSLNQKYGESEVNRHEKEMEQILKQYPMYLDTNIFPNGFELVFNEARRRGMAYQQQQQYSQQFNQVNPYQKYAAQMPRPNANINRVQNQRQMSQEEVERWQIFGDQQNKKGIFG
jgi:hypothetical protein